jgi:hypothetical protein
MALTAVVALLDSVTETLNGPRAAFFEADGVTLRLRLGCFLLPFTTSTLTTLVLARLRFRVTAQRVTTRVVASDVADSDRFPTQGHQPLSVSSDRARGPRIEPPS